MVGRGSPHGSSLGGCRRFSLRGLLSGHERFGSSRRRTGAPKFRARGPVLPSHCRLGRGSRSGAVSCRHGIRNRNRQSDQVGSTRQVYWIAADETRSRSRITRRIRSDDIDRNEMDFAINSPTHERGIGIPRSRVGLVSRFSAHQAGGLRTCPSSQFHLPNA